MMNRDVLLEKVINSNPELGWENKYPHLFGKYGQTITGHYTTWVWFENLKEATDFELLQMLAISSDYWLSYYKQNKSKKILEIELDAMRGAANCYKMHYENLAREIFEDLESLAKNIAYPEILENGIIKSNTLDGIYFDCDDFRVIKRKYVGEKFEKTVSQETTDDDSVQEP